MTFGPIDIIALAFPGNKFSGEGLAELINLVQNGTVRIIDLVMVIKDEEGNVFTRELQEFDPTVIAVFDPLDITVSSLVSTNDIEEIAESLPNNTSAAVMLYENLWAVRFVEAMEKADAQVVMQMRIPHAVVVQELADIAMLASQ
jgi:uncharacterized membrane protein